MMHSLLIANRGEIACRIIRSAKKLGIRTIAVFSDADAEALHVRLADQAIHIGPSQASESYLVGDKIIAAAKSSGADAIHPGYGFLSENAEFAEAVSRAGIIWVGPDASSIRAMGLKDAAKTLMQTANVPVTPGYMGADQSPEHLKAEAKKIGYPVLIKAVSGGGGKGMRKVYKAEEFNDALNACQREAKASFGDDTVLLEKWISNPRHIEVQIFGDTHGNIVHLFERDCTLQRRHQKVIEEAPAPGMDETTRKAICMAAVNAAMAVDYVGAGTVEFIADGSGPLHPERIWFMEMNTRLQVEHPVTEEITGVDLVEWQLRVASGEPLPKQQSDLTISGWAMEARLYAENPSTGFLPSTGILRALSLPFESARVDSGIDAGGEVSPHYDPMIAKLISKADTRRLARLALAKACDGVATYPVHNNAGFLSRLLRDEVFAAGDATTGFIGEHLDALTERPGPTISGVAAAIEQIADTVRSGGGASSADLPWNKLTGFRLNSAPDLEACIAIDGDNCIADLASTIPAHHNILQLGEGALLIENGWPFHISLPQHGSANGSMDASDGTIQSPMPGRIISVAVSEDEAVITGQTLLVIEAMKMEHILKSPFDGHVSGLAARSEDQVSEGQLLMNIIRPEADS